MPRLFPRRRELRRQRADFATFTSHFHRPTVRRRHIRTASHRHPTSTNPIRSYQRRGQSSASHRSQITSQPAERARWIGITDEGRTMSLPTSGRRRHHCLDGRRGPVDAQLGSGHRDAVVAEHGEVDDAAWASAKDSRRTRSPTASSSMSGCSRRQLGAHRPAITSWVTATTRPAGTVGSGAAASNTWMRSSCDVPAEIGGRWPERDDPAVREARRGPGRSRRRWWRHRRRRSSHTELCSHDAGTRGSRQATPPLTGTTAAARRSARLRSKAVARARGSPIGGIPVGETNAPSGPGR